MTGKLDLGNCLLLDADYLRSAVYMLSVETSPTSNDGYFMSVKFGVELRFLAVPRQLELGN